MIGVPLVLALALACLVGAVVARRRAVPRVARGAGDAAHGPALPGLVTTLARVPVPGAMARLAHAPDPQTVLWGAGIAGHDAPRLMRRARGGGIMAGVLVGAGLAVIATPLVVMVPVLGVLGRLLPDRLLAARATRRRQAIVRDLPDLLDLMVICVEAGMALDPALRMTARRLGGPLGDEVGAMLDAQALGTPRRAAYRALAERIGSDDVGRLVASLLQAEELGTPLATALGGQAEALRAVRRQVARDRAARAAPRIQLVVALVMVPGALLLVLGVMVVELAAQVTGVVG